MKPDERDDAGALVVLFVVNLIILGLLGAGVAAFVSYAGRGGM